MQTVCLSWSIVAGMAWVAGGEPLVQKQRGRWVVRQPGYDGATGRRQPKQVGTFATKREALAMARRITEGRAGTSEQSLEAYLHYVWIPSKEARVEQTTLNQYRWAIDGHIVPLIGAVRLRDLTPELVDGWIRDLSIAAEDGKPRLGPTSVRLVRKILSMALQEAVHRELIPRNPVSATRPPRAVRGGGRQSWTVTEARQFLGVHRSHRLYALFQLALVTGMRRGELLGLRWSDVDLEGGRISVSQQLAVVSGRPVMKSLKTEASERVVAVGPRTIEALRMHRERQAEDFGLLGMVPSERALLFTSEVGTWIDPNNLARTMVRMTGQAGVPRLTPKGLRHTAQSIGRVVVGDDKVMQERLGHADIGVTLNTYTHTVSEQHRRAGEQIDAVFE